MLSYQDTPTQEIVDKVIHRAGLQLLIKREDLNHPTVCGNKWWKLRYNLEEALKNDKKTLLTYGGAYSNHIYATAAAAFELNLHSIGMIRGEKHLPLNPVLSFATRMGMELRYVPRSDYRNKKNQPGNLSAGIYFLPEGGSNTLAVKGVCEFAKNLTGNFDYVCCPVGTGGTVAGLIKGLPFSKKILGFPVLKGGEFLKEEVKKLMGEECSNSNWTLIHDYHFGGYAKATPALHHFIGNFANDHGVPLEFIYTGKMMAGLYDLIEKSFFPRGRSILAIHTGGIRS